MPCNVEYNIPATLLKSKDKITVRFQSKSDTTAGGIFAVRLLVPESTVTDK